jgi:autotransporter-associated beta strand protein
LTKLGTGKLTLETTNLYSGPTIVQQGTLDLFDNLVNGTNSTIPNSVAIFVNGGATFGSQDGGGLPVTLSASASQILAGSGTCVGDFISPAGTTITPGTNGTIATLTFNNNLTLGGTVVYDVTSTTVHDLVSVAGSVTINPFTLQVNETGPLVDGVYPVVTATGSINGSVGDITITGFSQPGKIAILTQTANEIDLNISDAASDNLTWRGTGSDWDHITQNWLKGASPYLFTNGDSVTFDESGSGAATVNLDLTLVPSSVTVSNDATTYSFNDNAAGLGQFVGPVKLTKTGAGTLQVLTANNSFGPTIISNGTIQVGNGGTTGDLGTGNITNFGSLVFMQPDSRTVNGIITGSGGLTQNGGGTLTLAGNTTYTGPTTVTGGTLMVGTGGSSGTLASSTITNNSTLILNSKTSWTYSGGITGSGTLVKTGTNTFTLAGANSYGSTTVSNGVFKISPGSLPFAPLSVLGGRFDLNGSDLVPNGYGPGGPTTPANIVNNTTVNQTNTITFGTNDTAADVSAGILDNDGGSALGKIAIRKIGAGTLTLRSNNTYTGGTHVFAGTLEVASTNVQIAGTTLMENGTRFYLFQQSGGPNFNGTVQIAPSSTVVFDSSALGNNFAGAVIGDSLSTIIVTNSLSFGAANTNQLQLFPGTVHVLNPAELRFSTTSNLRNGGDSTTFIVDSGASLNTRNAGAVSLGALSGAGSVGGTQATNGGAVTYTIGLKNLPTTFSGTNTGIFDTNNTTAGNQTASFVKVGAAKLTFDGVLIYEGQTTVSNGILAIGSVANPATALTNGSGYQISAGGTLDLSATIGSTMNGTLTLDNHTNTSGVFVTNQFLAGGGTIIGSVNSLFGRVFPGDGIGTLTLTGNATLAGSMLMELNPTNAIVNDQLSVGGTINLTGCDLTVTNLGPTLRNGTTFQLFNKAIIGTLASTNLPGAPYVWSDNLHGNGSITLISGGVNPSAGALQGTLTGTTLSLSWPTNLGWTLMVQTNNLSSGLSGVKTDWAAVAGSTSMTSTNITVNRNNLTEFYKLVLPY